MGFEADRKMKGIERPRVTTMISEHGGRRDNRRRSFKSEVRRSERIEGEGFEQRRSGVDREGGKQRRMLIGVERRKGHRGVGNSRVIWWWVIQNARDREPYAGGR